ncbi:TetR/AcrR family transcriptional regulator [Actinomyces wuliandei]|uniref:TetR/AcrR family transcriptional regulator n=1 Tax=Actinomyces wuliandei TaxID=2057743 RepID=UPI000FD715EA|nr:TetR/AcrR family transcriptional regulator [Actinomyces wuliandei]
MTTPDTPPGEAGPSHRRGPGRPKAGSEDKRERILSEAVALFGSRGYAGTSLADVAAAADISKAGVLHHFSSKEELFTRVLERRDQRDVAEFLAQAEGSADPWHQLERYIELLHRSARSRELAAIYTATSVSVLDASHPAHHWMAAHLGSAVGLFEDCFEAGKRAGTVDPQMPSRMVARTLVALSDGLQLQWLCSTTPGSSATDVLETTVVDELRLYVDSLRARWAL